MMHEAPNTAPAPESSRSRGISISWKLFAYLALFTVFVLIVVWALQIGLLNYFYRQTKYQELEMTERALMDTVRNYSGSDEDFQEILIEVVGEYANEYMICTRVFRVQGSIAHQIAGEDVSGGCLIHHMSDRFLTYLYNQASNNGGVYTRQIRPGEYGTNGGLYPSDYETEGVETGKASPWRDQLMPTTTIDSINTLHVRLFTDRQGNEFIIMLNSELAPLSATVKTLQTQFWMIAALLLLGALFFAILISRNISRPIQQMNEAAKRLAKGQYDAGFRVKGYREVMELSDSLTHASEELSKNDKLQKELIANISHDLRTPLTMIIGYSEVMRDLPGENTPENVQVIIDETQRLSDLVNDLLDLSKLQSGTRKLTMERFSLTDLIENTMSRYDKLTRKDGYRVEYAFSESERVDVVADKTMILQVIYNLINNAINYTGEDKLVRVTQHIMPSGRVRISVTDSGEGIPADRIPLIWDRYYKIDKVHRRAMIGTGLGLSIVKYILEEHHTTYGVESKVGEGSTFWFELPVAEGKGQ